MPHRPDQVFHQLPIRLQEEIREEIINLFQQVIYEYLTTHPAASPEEESDHLCSPIEPQPSPYQSGEPAPAICSKTEGAKPRVAPAEH